MKEATGELNMTVITVVAIAAVAAIFYAWVWPTIKVNIAKNTCESSGYTECTITNDDLKNGDAKDIDCSQKCSAKTNKADN